MNDDQRTGAGDMVGARFRKVNMTGAEFRNVNLSGARFHGVDLTGAALRGVELVDVDIDGLLVNVTVNGVAIAPLVSAELDRRYPERAAMRPRDPAGFGAAWTILDRLWGETVARARTLDPALLHESVRGEWSFIETLRHLVFATDAWVSRAILGDPSPWTRWTCRGTKCRTNRASLGTGTSGRRWTRSCGCAPAGWRPCAHCSTASPSNSWPATPSRCRGQLAATGQLSGAGMPADRPRRGVAAPPVRRA